MKKYSHLNISTLKLWKIQTIEVTKILLSVVAVPELDKAKVG